MIYVSTVCVQRDKVRDSVETLARHGFRNIELSGGTKHYEDYEDDLFGLKEKYNLNYLIHNYFPPPKEDFVLNLASMDEGGYQKTLDHYEAAINLSRKLGADKFGIHAGTFIDVKCAELGKKIGRRKLSGRSKATERFCKAYTLLKEKAENVEVYIENHVLSYTNARTYQGHNPLMLTDYNSYLGLKNLIDFKLLLDVGHLKVSANSLNLSLDDELSKMMSESDYVHLSDNDGLHDQHKPFSKDSSLLRKLGSHDLKGKLITLEVCDDINKIIASYELITDLIGLKDQEN